MGGGCNTSGKTDRGQIVISLGCHQFSPKTSASRVLAKATTIFTRTSFWDSLFTEPWNQFASKGPVREDDTGEVKWVKPENGCFPICYPSTFQSLVRHLQAVTKYSELFICCISAPACCLAHRWVRLREAPEMEAENRAGKSGKRTNRPKPDSSQY